MTSDLSTWLAAQGLAIVDGRLLSIRRTLSPPEAFALEAARMTELRSRTDGPSPKSARRRKRLAERAKKTSSSLQSWMETNLPRDPDAEARVETLLARLPTNQESTPIEDR
jgi:hypothetical protein